MSRNMKLTSVRRRYRSPIRRAQKGLTKDSILGALVRQISRVGLGELSMQRLARDAGTSVVTIYRHYPTRVALVDAMYEWSLSRVYEAILPPNSPPRFPQDLDGFIESVFTSYEKN